ncbi:ABC transporter substrate-binding protein [Brenneria corticis]|uniref:Nitrate ABC transporter substrate-binding protein n=1 Tax=Brenneria corticis TaxID=2173106 RepID=A0A2U1U456_9GAMM|nr:ABC transporter substrate-binding protein [Brenneria sp. CFCC 11842]PWC16443.1 nitrate ABC transporter substrate-binding protein [Brenneria sp. CFCC 11842]
MKIKIVIAALLAFFMATAGAAQKLTIADQYGLPYLLFTIAKEKKLIESQARAAGVEVDIEWRQVPGGPEIMAAILSGSIDIGAGGISPVLTMWDKTSGLDNIRAIIALSAAPSFLVTNRADIKTVEDFKPADRIAVPGVKVSGQARYLQMAAARAFGKNNWRQLDDLTVSMPHPEAANALISGKTEIVAHMSSAPFQNEELNHPYTHIVFSSYDVLGAGATSAVAFTSERFRKENPAVYAAFVAAINQAAEFVKNNPPEAANIFKAATKSRLSTDEILNIINDKDYNFDTRPSHTFELASFLRDIGAIARKPTSERDYFFDPVQ